MILIDDDYLVAMAIGWVVSFPTIEPRRILGRHVICCIGRGSGYQGATSIK